MSHLPVLLAEVLGALEPSAGATYVDATFGGGGYSQAILDAADCRVIGLDRDPAAIARGAALAAATHGRLSLVETPFGAMREVLRGRAGLPDGGLVDGIVFDLGVSSFQLDDPARGFSFREDGPLDMRMGGHGPTAADLLAELDPGLLVRLLRDHGDEPDARRIVRAVVTERTRAPLRTTAALAALVARVKGGRHGRIDPATRVFQALRIAVNDEIGELGRGLEAAQDLIRPGGRLVVVAFHSGEDAVVKRFINERGGRPVASSRHLPPLEGDLRPRWRWLERRVRRPEDREVATNPRAHSARLRAAVRLADTPSAQAGDAEGGWRCAA